jgi:hypothetical protein
MVLLRQALVAGRLRCTLGTAALKSRHSAVVQVLCSSLKIQVIRRGAQGKRGDAVQLHQVFSSTHASSSCSVSSLSLSLLSFVITLQHAALYAAAVGSFCDILSPTHN